MVGELNTRFNDLNKSLMKAMNACSPNSASFLDFDVLKPILDNYHVEEEDIQIELIQSRKVLKDHDLQTLSDVIDILQPLKPAFPGVFLRILQIAIMFAVTTASSEKGFPSLKRNKTYLQSTMSEQRLSHLAILSRERELSSHIAMKHIVDKFAAKNRRISL